MKTRLSFQLLVAGILMLSFMDMFAQDNEMIWLTSVPGWGNASANLYGRVNANPQQYKVAGVIFIEEAGGWWTKPSFDNPTVQIAADSTFVLDFVTGGMDRYCTRLLTVLVPNSYSVPLFGGVGDLPAGFLEHPYAITARPHGDRKLEWGGIGWTVKRTVDNLVINPGPNLFNSDANNVFIDNNSDLHIKITSAAGQWLCSELIADTSLGFGTYTFNLRSRVDNMDIHAVTGIFTWDDIAPYSASMPEAYYREFDIEFGYWSIPGNDVGQYVIQPWTAPENIYRFPIGSEINTIHQWTWKMDTIEFISMREDSSVIAEFDYTGDYYKNPGLENVRINLWLNFGQAPSAPQETILSGFEFRNLLAAPQNVTATDGDTLKVTITWNPQPGRLFGVYRGITDNPLEAQLLNGDWILQPSFVDGLVEPGQTYYYWVRSSDNIHGSNTTGYASGYSDHDSGWAAGDPTKVPILDLNDHICIFPNPCDDYTRVTLGDTREALLRVYGPAGNLILQRTVVAETILETGAYPQGVYFLQLFGGAGDTFKARIIVNH